MNEPKPGDIVRVRLSCHVHDHGRWANNEGLEVVRVDGPQIVVKRAGAQYPTQYIVDAAELTTGKGRGTSTASRRRYAREGRS